jgi:small conductance mechanosensitive channel
MVAAMIRLAQIAFVLLSLGWAGAAPAAEPTPAGDEVARLVTTLENPAERDKLLAQLKALQAASPPARPAEDDIWDRLAAKAGDLRVGIASLIIVAAAVIAAKLVRRLIHRALTFSHHRHGHPSQGRALGMVQTAARFLVGLAGALALAQLWGLDPLSLLSSELGRKAAGALVNILVAVVGALVAWHLLHGAIERYLNSADKDGNPLTRSARARTLLPMLRTAAFILLVVLVALVALSELGINIAPLLAGAGVLGIAVGFGSQKLVQDIITGLFILFEDTMAVGDAVKIGDHAGTVEALSIRAIRLRDSNGNLHTVPFSAVTTVVNATKGFNFAVFDVGIAYHEDTDRVAGVLSEIGADLKSDPKWGAMMAADLEVLGVERFDPSAVILRARVKTTPGDHFALMREFNRRLKQRFDALGIEMPFPQTQVWLRNK